MGSCFDLDMYDVWANLRSFEETVRYLEQADISPIRKLHGPRLLTCGGPVRPIPFGCASSVVADVHALSNYSSQSGEVPWAGQLVVKNTFLDFKVPIARDFTDTLRRSASAPAVLISSAAESSYHFTPIAGDLSLVLSSLGLAKSFSDVEARFALVLDSFQTFADVYDSASSTVGDMVDACLARSESTSWCRTQLFNASVRKLERYERSKGVDESTLRCRQLIEATECHVWLRVTSSVWCRSWRTLLFCLARASCMSVKSFIEQLFRNLDLESTRKDFFSLLAAYKGVRNWQIQKVVDAMSKFHVDKSLTVVSIFTREVRIYRPFEKVLRYWDMGSFVEEDQTVVRTVLFFDKIRDTYTLYKVESV